jgi:hypothetical protein
MSRDDGVAFVAPGTLAALPGNCIKGEWVKDEWAKRLRFAITVALGVESLLTLWGALYLTTGLLSGDQATERNAAIWEAGIAWSLGLTLAILAWGVVDHRRWARGPVITVQLLALPVGWSALSSEKWYIGVVLLSGALLGLSGVHPAVLGRAGGGVDDPGAAEPLTRPR